MPNNKMLDPMWVESYLNEQEEKMMNELDAEETKSIMHAVRVMSMQLLLKQAKK
ncbi:hypothetical protein [Brevibacillus migulae]|uniref:hypothetical protein n=1 Tax=Brevibacillus migulae TaxID=1644114 RepID=UPI001431F11C|nr:hypothetical protein [Brevibacillus migulae]